MRSARMGRAQDSGDRPAPGGSKAPPSNSWPLVSPFCPPASACSSPESIPGTRQNLPVARVCGVVLFVFLCPYFYLCLFLCLCLRMVMPIDTLRPGLSVLYIECWPKGIDGATKGCRGTVLAKTCIQNGRAVTTIVQVGERTRLLCGTLEYAARAP